jgi:hypothetical protein
MTDLTVGATQYLEARRMAARRSIDELESAMRRGISTGEFVETLHEGGTDEGHDQCQHYFGDGVYVRSLWIPAGTVVVGRLHLQARVCMVLAGRCKFVDEFQEQIVEAPWIGEFKAGSKTAVFAETDTLWAAVVGTDIKDPQEAFYKLTAGSHRDLLENQT